MSAFVSQLTREGCHINAAQIICKQYYPPVWKWFVYKWAHHQGTEKGFFKKYIPTHELRIGFMKHLAEHGFFQILRWAYLNGCCENLSANSWLRIANSAGHGGYTEIEAWATGLAAKQWKESSFIPPDIPQLPRRPSRKKKFSRNPHGGIPKKWTYV